MKVIFLSSVLHANHHAASIKFSNFPLKCCHATQTRTPRPLSTSPIFISGAAKGAARKRCAAAYHELAWSNGNQWSTVYIMMVGILKCVAYQTGHASHRTYDSEHVDDECGDGDGDGDGGGGDDDDDDDDDDDLVLLLVVTIGSYQCLEDGSVLSPRSPDRIHHEGSNWSNCILLPPFASRYASNGNHVGSPKTLTGCAILWFCGRFVLVCLSVYRGIFNLAVRDIFL